MRRILTCLFLSILALFLCLFLWYGVHLTTAWIGEWRGDSSIRVVIFWTPCTGHMWKDYAL